jgi:serine protease
LLTDDSEPDAHILARQLSLQPEVLYAEPNYLRFPQAIPTDPSFLRQWNLASIDMARAWDIQPEPGKGVIVAVIDTGVTAVSQSLVFPTWDGRAIVTTTVPFGVTPDIASDRLLPGFDFAFFLAGQPIVDMVGHGTHVASTIAEEANNALFGVGLAHKAVIMPLKACIGYWELQFIRSSQGVPGFNPLTETGGCPSSATAAAIRYAADNGAKVINLSLSGTGGSQTERDALNYAVGKGVFIAAAMGNHFETGNVTHYPAGFAPEIRGLMSVGATGRSTRRSFYSATGGHIEIAAPGGDSRDGGSDGVVWQASIAPSDFSPATVIFPRFNRYIDVGFQGTSMATPHVAAMAAMLIAQGVTKPADIETLITRTALDLGEPGKDNDFGYGLIQPRAALFGMGVR